MVGGNGQRDLVVTQHPIFGFLIHICRHRNLIQRRHILGDGSQNLKINHTQRLLLIIVVLGHVRCQYIKKDLVVPNVAK